jgi:hypothetical protein
VKAFEKATGQQDIGHIFKRAYKDHELIARTFRESKAVFLEGQSA